MPGLIIMKTRARGKIVKRNLLRLFSRHPKCLTCSLPFDGECLTHRGKVVDIKTFSHFMFIFHETNSPRNTMLALLDLEKWLQESAPHIRIVNPPSCARFVSDKLWQYSALRAAHLKCPEFWALDTPRAIDSVRFPALLRHPASYGGNGIAPAYSLDEAVRICGSMHTLRMAVEIVDTRIHGHYVRYRAIICGSRLLNAFALVSDHFIVNAKSLKPLRAAYEAAQMRLQQWLFNDRSAIWDQICSALGMHTLCVDFFLTEDMEPIIFDIGLKIGEGTAPNRLRRSLGVKLNSCSPRSYLHAILKL